VTSHVFAETTDVVTAPVFGLLAFATATVQAVTAACTTIRAVIDGFQHYICHEAVTFLYTVNILLVFCYIVR